MQTEMQTAKRASVYTATGAVLFALWGILHSWVGFDGLNLYFTDPVRGQWDMYVGGKNAPLSEFKMPVDPVTMHVHANILLNLCLDIGGYGLFGILVAWMLYKRPSWFVYWVGVVMVGICDLSFTFLQLTSGIISLNIASISGPVLWLIAAIITPFGLRSKPELNRNEASA